LVLHPEKMNPHKCCSSACWANISNEWWCLFEFRCE